MKRNRGLEKLVARLDKLSVILERMNLNEYIAYLSSPKRMIWRSLLLGIARGVGSAIGFTILGAAVFILLKNLADQNLPVIGDFIARILELVEKSR